MIRNEESHAHMIINAMPGLLVTVDYHLNVIYMNKAAEDLFNITRKKTLIGNPISQIMDDYALVNMVAFDKKMAQDQITLPDGITCLDRVFSNDRENQVILCVMKDITKDIEFKKKQTKAQMLAIEMADRLMSEQLQMVHQMAELLGEAAADTKVAVENLKSAIMQEEA